MIDRPPPPPKFDRPAKPKKVECYECDCPPPKPDYTCRKDVKAHEKDVVVQKPGTKLERMLYAYDKASGRLLAEVPLPANAGGAPMTYLAAGVQYVAIPVGGSNIPEEVIALALP